MGNVSLDVDVLLEGRAVVGSTTKSWEGNGLGKVRYGADAGGGRRVLLRPEAAVIFTPRFGFDVTGKVVLTANDQRRQTVDITEAFLEYKPAPASAFGFRARGGAFFPPISQENTGLAWTSPYTITSSAINSWVGEELKAIGVEVTPYWRGEDLTIELTAASYMANDPTGTLLAERGWSFNDRETGLLDWLQLAQIRIIRPGDNLDTQAPTGKPFHEVDGSAGIECGTPRLRQTVVPLARQPGRRSCLRAIPMGLAHGFRQPRLQSGVARRCRRACPGHARAHHGHHHPRPNRAYRRYPPLVGLRPGQQGIRPPPPEFPGEYFKTTDRDTLPDNNNEHGFGLTAAYVFHPADNQRLTVEFLYVNSLRPERAFLATAPRARETQISYHLFF